MSDTSPHADAPGRPQVVCLCGSTRFRAEFDAANRRLTLAGCIVLAPGMFGHAEGVTLDEADKGALDRLHLAKIDLADRVFVVDPGGYVGDSTRAEIAYATRLGKLVEYLEPVTTDARPRLAAADEQAVEVERLRSTMTTIAELTGGPCSPPDVANGYDLCPCGRGQTWPCSSTRAAWLARGLAPDVEQSKTMQEIRNQMIAASPEW